MDNIEAGLSGEIPSVIHQAISNIKKVFPDISIEIVSKMYRQKPDEYAKAGRLGLDITIMGIKTFFGCESLAEEMICNPFAVTIIENFVYTVAGKEYRKMLKKKIKNEQ